VLSVVSTRLGDEGNGILSSDSVAGLSLYEAPILSLPPIKELVASIAWLFFSLQAEKTINATKVRSVSRISVDFKYRCKLLIFSIKKPRQAAEVF
jgi:hypothetical protein